MAFLDSRVMKIDEQAVTAGERASLPRTAGEFAELGAALETMRTKLEGKQYVERYVQDLTHEMKSPLAAILASAELLEQPMGHADRTQFAHTILAQSERLSQMIERLLALAAVEHRQRLDAPQWIVIAELFERVATDVRGKPLPCGHYIAEEAPDALLAEALPFLCAS